jgi:hypothetical protein
VEDAAGILYTQPHLVGEPLVGVCLHGVPARGAGAVAVGRLEQPLHQSSHGLPRSPLRGAGEEQRVRAAAAAATAAAAAARRPPAAAAAARLLLLDQQLALHLPPRFLPHAPSLRGRNGRCAAVNIQHVVM